MDERDEDGVRGDEMDWAILRAMTEESVRSVPSMPVTFAQAELSRIIGEMVARADFRVGAPWSMPRYVMTEHGALRVGPAPVVPERCGSVDAAGVRHHSILTRSTVPMRTYRP